MPALVLVSAALALAGALPSGASGAVRSLVPVADTTGCASSFPPPDCGNARGMSFSIDLAVSPDGEHAYAIGAFPGTISVLDRNPATGGITELAGAAGCVSMPGGPDTATCGPARALDYGAAVVVSPDGKHVYAGAADGVAAFSRNATTGALTQLPGSSGCRTLTGRGHSKDPSTAGQCALSRATDWPYSIAISPDGTSVYVASRNSDGIALFQRDALTGALTQPAGPAGCITENGWRSPFDEGTAGQCTDGAALMRPEEVVVSPDGKFVYAASTGMNRVSVMVRDQATGVLTPAPGSRQCTGGNYSTTDGGSTACGPGSPLDWYPASLTIPPDGTSLYVANVRTDAVTAYGRNTTTGELTPMTGPGSCVTPWFNKQGCDVMDYRDLDFPWSLAVRADGRRLHVGMGEGIMTLDRDPATGRIHVRGREASCIGFTTLTCAPARPQTVGAVRGVIARDRTVLSVGNGVGLAAFVEPTLAVPGETMFGIQEVGTPAPERTIAVRNEGVATVTIGATTFSGEHASSFTRTGGTCGATLAAGATCTIEVTMTPQERAYIRADLDVVSNGPTSPDSGALTGVGVITQPPPPGLQPLPGSEACITETGREAPRDPATAGRCAVGKGVGFDAGTGSTVGPRGVGVSPDGAHVYTVGFQNDIIADTLPWRALSGFDRNAGTGLLTGIPEAGGCRVVPAIAGCGALDHSVPAEIVVSADGLHAYVGSEAETLHVLDRDTTTGVLTERPAAGGCFADDGYWHPYDDKSGPAPCTVVPGLGSNDLLLSPDGKHLYANGGDGITVFDRNTTTGALTRKAGAAGCYNADGDTIPGPPVGDPCTLTKGANVITDMVFSADGTHLFVAGTAWDTGGLADTVTVLNRASDGTLSQKTGDDRCIAEVTRGNSSPHCRDGRALEVIRSIALSPDGLHLYVAAEGDDGIALLDVHPTTRVLTQRTTTEGCMTRTGRSNATSAATAGSCAVGRAVDEVKELAMAPDGGLIVAAGQIGSFAPNEGAVVALARNTTTGVVTVSGCYTQSTRSYPSEAVTTGDCTTSRVLGHGTDVVITPDGEHAYTTMSGPRTGVLLFDLVKPTDPAPGPAVSVMGAAIEEGAAPNVEVELALGDPAIRDATVDVTTQAVTATAGADYTTTTTTVDIDTGDTSATVAIPVADDAAAEDVETFRVRATGSDGVVLAVDEAEVTILDDDEAAAVPPALSVADAEIVEGDAGEQVLRFAVTRPAGADESASARFVVTAGTAAAGADYEPRAGSVLLFGAADGVVEVPVLGDGVDESDETFTVTLSAPDGATIGDGVATGTIRDDDATIVTPDPKPEPEPKDDPAPQPVAENPIAPSPPLLPSPLQRPPPAPAGAVAAQLGLPTRRACVSRRRFRIKLRQPRGERLASAEVLVAGKRVKAVRGARVTAPVDLRNLPKGSFAVEVRAVTASGKRLTETRRYRTCAPKAKRKKKR